MNPEYMLPKLIMSFEKQKENLPLSASDDEDDVTVSILDTDNWSSSSSGDNSKN